MAKVIHKDYDPKAARDSRRGWTIIMGPRLEGLSKAATSNTPPTKPAAEEKASKSKPSHRGDKRKKP